MSSKPKYVMIEGRNVLKKFPKKEEEKSKPKGSSKAGFVKLEIAKGNLKKVNSKIVSAKEAPPKKKIIKKKPAPKAKPAPASPPAKPKSISELKKEAKEKGVKGISSMNRADLLLALKPRDEKLIKSYTPTAMGNLMDFANSARKEFEPEELRRGNREQLLKEADLFLDSPKGNYAGLLFAKGKMDNSKKQEAMRLINALDKSFKEFNIDIKKGRKLP